MDHNLGGAITLLGNGGAGADTGAGVVEVSSFTASSSSSGGSSRSGSEVDDRVSLLGELLHACEVQSSLHKTDVCRRYNKLLPNRNHHLFSTGLDHLMVRLGSRADVADLVPLSDQVTRISLPAQILRKDTVVELLQNCNALKELTVRFSPSKTEASDLQFLKGLSMRSVNVLKLSGDAGSGGMAEKVASACGTLSVLDLTNWQADFEDVEDLMRHSWRAEKLVFRGVPCIGSGAFSGLAKSTREFPRLLELDLSHQPLFDGQGLAHWMRKAPTLRSLNLFNCPNVSDANVEAGILAARRTLHSVFLSKCSLVGDRTVRALSECRWLRDVNLNGTSVTDHGLADLSKIEGLQTVYLRGCEGVTADGVRMLLGGGRRHDFERVDVTGCSITGDELARLWDEFPRVSITVADQADGVSLSPPTGSSRTDMLTASSSD